jgi:hypothetical protein
MERAVYWGLTQPPAVLGRLEVQSRQTEVVLLVMLGKPHQKQREALVAIIKVAQLVMVLSGRVAAAQQVQTLTMVQQTRQ